MNESRDLYTEWQWSVSLYAPVAASVRVVARTSFRESTFVVLIEVEKAIATD